MNFTLRIERVYMLWLAAGFVAILLTGCGDSGLAQQDYERAKAALEKALNAWKGGEPAKKWTDTKAAVRFVDDDWIKGNRLKDYQLVSLRANVDGVPEAVVRLTTEPEKGGQPTTRDALYAIDIRKADQVVIGRDPMY